MIKRDLGREGEDAFSGWCNNAGISCNPSTNDKYGWDFIVEFPTDRTEGIPIDSLPPPIECKVQVKSTEGNRKGEQVKVSALYRLVKYGNPAFVCFIEYGPAHHPESAYLVHIDQSWVDKVLKRVRELEMKGKGDKLHLSKITIKYTDVDRIETLDGSGIKKKIKEFILNGMDEYVDQKKECLKNSGNPGFKLRTTFDIEDVEDFIDVSLGLKESVKIKDVKAFSSRFNIALPDTGKSSSDGAILSMPGLKPVFIHKLIFKESEYSLGIEFSANVYISALDEHLPNNSRKFRISSDIVEIISKGDNVSINFNFKLDEVVQLSVLKKQMSLLGIIKSSSELFYELRDENDRKLYSGNLNTQSTEIDITNEVFKTFNQALKICNFFDVTLDDILASLTSIATYENEIEQLYVHIDANPSDLKVTVNLESDDTLSDKYAIISAPTTMIGGYAFGLLVSFKYDLDADMEKEIYKQYCGPYKSIKDVPFNAHIEEYEERLKQDGYHVEFLHFGTE